MGPSGYLTWNDLIGILTKEAKAEVETHLVTAETKINRCLI